MPRSHPLVALARLFVFTIVALLVPAKHWSRVALWIAPILVLTRRSKLAENGRRLEGVLNRKFSPAEVREFEAKKSAHGIATFARIMGHHFSKGLEPEIRINGTEYVEDALKAGQGAIFWIASLEHMTLISKMGFAQAGYAVSHLSREGHGYGTSAFACKYLNHFATDIEDRYIRERLTMIRNREMPILRILRERLKENGLVSIVVGSDGNQTRTLPCLGGRLKVATGAPNLSFASGAPLLPVFVLRQPDGSFDMTIDQPLSMPEDDDREQRTDIVLKELISRFEPFIVATPDQWSTWADLSAAE